MRAGFFPGFWLAAGLGLFLAGPALAQPPREPGVQPLDRILPGIRHEYPGEFYDADGPTPGPDGQEHYHLKWMTPDGRIEWLDTDARTGRVLRSAPGRDAFDQADRGRFFRPAPSMPPPAFSGRERDFGERGMFRNEGRGAGEFRGGGRGGYGGGRGRER
jgi:hypothetical protein